jgi:hypothetical protein
MLPASIVLQFIAVGGLLSLSWVGWIPPLLRLVQHFSTIYQSDRKITGDLCSIFPPVSEIPGSSLRKDHHPLRRISCMEGGYSFGYMEVP